MKLKKQGLSLIEVVIGVGLMGVIMVALVSAVSVSLRNSQVSQNRSRATKYMTEGIEAVRSIRDRDKSVFFALSTAAYYLNYDTSGLQPIWKLQTSPKTTPALGFTRTIQLERLSATEMRVTVTIGWQQGSAPYSTKSTTTFTQGGT